MSRVSPELLRKAPSLATAFTRCVRRHPSRIALRDGGRSVSYGALGRRVRDLAAGLADALPAGTARPLVALVLQPGTDAVAALLASLAAGAAYLPLDATAPDAYLRALLDDAQPDLVLTDRARLAGLGRAALDIDALASRGRVRSSGRAPAGPTDPAYVIYTSGSTGAPKGVQLAHEAMLYSTAARLETYGPAGRVPLLHAPSVDVYSGVVFWALLTGGTLVIGPQGLRDVAATVELIRSEQVTDLVYLSSLYPALLDYAAVNRPVTLRQVMIGSDRWNESLIDRHAELLPAVHLFNEYGPSEAAVWSSGARVWDGTARRRSRLTIGTPLPGSGYRLLDARQRPVTGGEGELYITGRQLALGYLHRPELTAASFVTLADGQRAYRTGDLAELTPDGGYVFTGRADRQIKVQGHRIEPAHIERVLMEHPHIALAHVTAHRTGASGAVLAAYLTPRPGHTALQPQTVRQFATERLLPHLVPALWRVLDELPRMRSGKIDEAALPDPVPATPAGPGPADALEADLAEAAGRILGSAPPAVTVPLTEAGASSLALIRLAAHIEGTHQVRVAVSALFTQPTLRQIADHVRTAAPTGRPPLTRSETAGPVPLTDQQRQIYFLDQLAPASAAYRTQCSLHLTGPLNVPALEQALGHIVERHEILRTTVHTGRDGQPVQVVHDPWPVRLTPVDLTGLGEAERRDVLEELLRREMAGGFDTGRLPLVRWTLYRLGESQWRLFQVEHHFIHDGWSATLLLGEIRDAYAAYATGRTPQLGDLPVQYAHWARWQQAWKGSEDYALQRAYWRTALNGCPVEGVSFATDYPRPARQGFDGACVRADIPAPTVERLDAVAAGHGVTRFAVFITAFALLVHQQTRSAEFVIGSALSNRRQPGTQGLLGMFVNALPLRLSVGEDESVADVAARTMRVLLGAQDHQEYPLAEIIRDLDVPRDAGRNPLFSLMFAFHDTPRPDFTAAGVRGELFIDHNGSAKADVNVVCVPHPAGSAQAGGVNVLWEYNTALFTADTARHLVESFGRILGALADPATWAQPATALDVLDAWQIKQATALGHGPAVRPAHALLHAGARTAAARWPAAVAVEQGSRRVTHEELDRAAGAIEAQLAHIGAGPGDRVAVACGPGPEHIAALCGVLARGAAFLCLDPGDPAPRLAALLRDAAPAAVVCSPRTAPVLRPLVDGQLPVVEAGQAPGRPVAATGRRVRPRPQDPAYLVYTSGSTGTPKAVVATHANAVTALTARSSYVGGEAARTLITLPLAFDVASSMIFWTLWNGGTLVFPNHEDDVRDPEAVWRLIDAHHITHVNFVPSFYRHMLAAMPAGGGASLRVVAVGGERCPHDLARSHAERVAHARLDNEYGPTEGTVWCTAACLYHPHRPMPTPAGWSVGRPLANHHLLVLDERQGLLPVGALGEVCLAGPAVAAGYLDRPELTAERFPTPASGPLAGVRLYRTGDEGRLTPGGEVQVVGRLDEQVKIRGYRVEAGEVAHTLAAHPDIHGAHVRAEEHQGIPRLVAYIATPAARRPDLADAVRAWAAQRLPHYMVPAEVVLLDALPVLPNGKVNPAALPRPVPALEPRR
ncbi:amino acid adenylation domain-containing protein [Streptomyces sp. NPDC021100]|uniref:amino acid adenylation domain-containing protein n=1 Tax=Streptomyces sp. NPDC021100 TaxID=3365114 RepID=UPI0037AB4271